MTFAANNAMATDRIGIIYHSYFSKSLYHRFPEMPTLLPTPTVNAILDGVNAIQGTVGAFPGGVNPVPGSVNPIRGDVGPILGGVKPIRVGVGAFPGGVVPSPALAQHHLR
jgi:hypothetical protein